MVWIVIAVVVVLALLVGLAYNSLVAKRNRAENAWAQIDVQLRRRYDLIPNLVETVKGYAGHETGIFEEVARTRSMAAGATGSPAEQAAAEGPFMAALGKLFAVAENYPDLKANQTFLALQSELSNTEDRIQTSRRFYNNNVMDYNRRVQSFPSNLIARNFHFTEEQFFEIEDAVRETGPPRVDFSAGGGSPVEGGGASGAGNPPSSPAPQSSAPPPPPSG